MQIEGRYQPSGNGRLLTDDNELVKDSILVGQMLWDFVVRSGQFQ